jgi:exodeoxyribonuclease V alpha subunit
MNKPLSPLQIRLRQILADHEARKLSANTIPSLPKQTANVIPTGEATTPDYSKSIDKYGNVIHLNAKQQEAISLALSGKSFILIGAAGTGKTTTVGAIMSALIGSGKVPQFGSHAHKHLPSGHAPGISISAYTRRATNNIRRNLSEDLKANAITIHKLLQYEPVYYETDTGKKTMRFEPTKNHLNPQPPNLHTCVIEEASMVAVELFNEVEASNPQKPQYIFLGDIQQLPPVFGSAILGYKMLELPVIELTEVYRQALESPIISLAHRILSGKPIPLSEYQSWNVPNKLTIHPWKKKINPEPATLTLAKFFIQALTSGAYNPETDGILIPFNKSCGSDELNRHIANAIAKGDERPVYEIIHRFKKSYYSIGDKCLYEKEDVIIKNIYPNPEYAGALPQIPSLELDYWGNMSEKGQADIAQSDDIDFLLGSVGAMSSEDDERVRAASHCVVIYRLDSDTEIIIKTAGELNNLSLGYAITVHKSQGSEWRKVFLCFHHSHATMLQRELLYTGVTRAREELFIICEDDTFTKGILNQRIKGNTLAEKAEFFKGKLDNKELQS